MVRAHTNTTTPNLKERLVLYNPLLVGPDLGGYMNDL